MEGTVMLMLLTGFLAFIVFRLDQNEAKKESTREALSENDKYYWFSQGYQRGLSDTPYERPIDVTPTQVITRKKKRK